MMGFGHVFLFEISYHTKLAIKSDTAMRAPKLRAKLFHKKRAVIRHQMTAHSK